MRSSPGDDPLVEMHAHSQHRTRIRGYGRGHFSNTTAESYTRIAEPHRGATDTAAPSRARPARARSVRLLARYARRRADPAAARAIALRLYFARIARHSRIAYKCETLVQIEALTRHTCENERHSRDDERRMIPGSIREVNISASAIQTLITQI